MSSLFETTYNPDVLSCIANLSNDEVFTPPELANKMLDLLPQEIWKDPNATFLDPACKSGVFLREIAKRLIKGLESEYPDLQERLEHIYKKQIFGIAITELTSLLSRRSLYCSKYPNSRYSVVQFVEPQGRIDYRQLGHTWEGGRCKYCGVPKSVYDRKEGMESYAYEFIHLTNPEEVFKVKFDVIIGNPPYQMNDGGGNGSSAMPIYHHFINQAKKLNPRYLCMIIPAKWQSGGKGLDSFRDTMLHDHRIKEMVTYSDSRDCFQGVDIAGGVSYFLWQRDYEGLCESTFIENGEMMTSQRKLDEYSIYIASDKAIHVIRTIQQRASSYYDGIVRSRKPFGIGAGSESNKGDLKLRYRGGLTTVSSCEVTSGLEMVDQWKVIVSKAAAEHAGQSDKNGQRKMLTVIEVLPPRTVCSETYLVVDAFDSQREAENLADYLRTKFARYLIWQATPTQNISKSCFMFLPVVDLSKKPVDSDLYTYFGLDEASINEIEAKMKPILQVGDSGAN